MAEEFLNPDYRDLLRAFSAADVRFLVVGAYALAFHGLPRATGDLDVWIDAAPDNAAAAYGALREFGAPLHELKESDLARPGIVFQIGLAPNRVDVLTEISGVSFGEAWPRRIPVRYGGLSFHVISREDLIANKRAAGRDKDLLDLRALEKMASSGDRRRKR